MWRRALGIMAVMALAATCSKGSGGDGSEEAGGESGEPGASGGSGGEDSQESSDAGADMASGGQGGAAGSGGAAGGMGSGGQTASGGTAGGGSGGGGSAGTLEPPPGVNVDWQACEPGGNCPNECPARPARAAHKPKDFTAKDFRGPVFVPDADGVIVVEAESLAHSGNWRRATTNPTTTDGSRFTGEGYLVWDGYAVSGIEEDAKQDHQGNRCDWLVIKYWIRPEDEDLYTWDVRTHNVLADGDNDAWHGRIGQSDHVRRLVTGAGNNKKFTFERAAQLLYPAISLKAGLHAMYIQGRSVGFGIDRIVLHRGGTTRALARDPARAASKPFPAGFFK